MRVTSKGQVTIPIEIREQLGIGSGTEVEFEVVGNAVQLRPRPDAASRGRRVVARLRATPYGGPTTEQLMALTRGEP